MFKLKNMIEDNDLWILFESGNFGDSIENRKLGFTDSDIQVTLIPKKFHVRPKTKEHFSNEGRLEILVSKTPLLENQKIVCDQECSHLVKSIRPNKYQGASPCYVKGTTIFHKAMKVHHGEIKEAIFFKGEYKIRFSIWGDVSRIQNPRILTLIKTLIQNSSKHFAYSVNPPKSLKPFFMKSVTSAYEAIDSMEQGFACYLGDKEFSQHNYLRLVGRKTLIQCFSLGDGDPLLPTCSTCKTPCSGTSILGPHTVLASNKSRSSIYTQAKRKTIKNIYDVIKLTEEL